VPEFESALRQVEFRAPAVPVISCTTAARMTSPRRDLAAALTRPVRWAGTMQALAALDIRRYVDAGPGQVLAKLARRNVAATDALPLADLALEPARG
jgi:malonyl CoA-acyl carrier protein transacylase